jgi:phage host-nuclease inhibitor protein Gam
MTTKRIKQSGPAIQTRQQMERLVSEICQLTIDRDAATAEMDDRLLKVRQDYETTLARHQEDLDAKMALAQAWAEANPSEFAGKKSIEMVHGTVGFRTGMPKLKLLTGWTWDRVKDALQNGNFRDYIRTKQEVDKERLLADREQIGDAMRTVCGCRVVQDEPFFVEPKRDAQEERLTA